MRRDQVPQDDANLMEGRSREVCYAVDEKGNYVQAHSTGWEPKNAALLQAWEQINEEAEKARLDVQEGRVSPLAFFMAKFMFDLKLLSEYTDIPKRKIKMHLDPLHFKKLDEATLAKYAYAFDITADDLANWPAKPVSTRFPGSER
ncbi:MAG: hypothetical protein A4E66_01132 [Syntrophus sp. PtaB.Bin001]|nr:MAG: hypothetical protein A4E66_01132 [Syntrophus sp. PtaB.Bin001]